MLGLARFRRRRRTAFWLLRADALIAAVLEPTTDEPLLLACAEVSLRSCGSSEDFAPGLLETAAAVRALDLTHVAALDRMFCRLEPAGGGTACAGVVSEEVSVPVAGRPDLCALASKSVIAKVISRFASARLKLVAVDAGPCALMNLDRHLARSAHNGSSQQSSTDADLDPLTAVSVAPDCELEAGRLAHALAVPVGLALARFGLVDHA